MDTVPKYFYDTCSLLNYYNQIFTSKHKFAISEVSIRELENIKVSPHKDEDTKYKARQVVKLLTKNQDQYDVILMTDDIFNRMEVMELDDTPDNRITMSATYYYEAVSKNTFVTDDFCLYNIAKNLTPIPVKLGSEVFESTKEIYKGYKEVTLSDEELAYFYEHLNDNIYNCLINEYLLIKNSNSEIVDKRKWNGKEYEDVKIGNLKSTMLGNIKPLDEYQSFVIDSFNTNKVTMIKGSAGSGKSYLTIAYLMSQLEKHKIDKIVIFCNTIATMNSAKLGYYPGTKDQKLLDSQIGNMLASKFGDKIVVEKMINEDKLVLLPMSDIRGFDTTNMNAGIWITEAQNLDISLMKLALQRLGEDSVCIIDGDQKAQVDDYHFAGNNNGMKRASEVFRNTDVYGEITLNKVYRSKIAEIAEAM